MLAAAAAAIAIWGGTPIVTKIAVAEVDPLVVGMLRTLLAAAVIAPIAFLGRIARPRTAAEIGLLAASAIGGFIVFPVLFSLGQRHTSASHAALILATLPLFTGLFAAIIERRMPGPRWWLGAAVAGGGEVLLVGLRFGFEGSAAGLAGDLLIVASCVAASMGYVAGGRLSRSLGTWPTTLWGITAAGLVLLPALPFAARDVAWAAVSTASWASIGYLAFLSTVLGYVAWYWALARGGIARIGITQFAQPVVSLALAVAILGEAMTLPLAATAACIIAGIWIAQRRREPVRK
ncbi:MAG: DMT family transporter [Alphaproteobacteria bacterium]